MTKIRIAVAGAGMIGQAHIKVLGDSPSCMLSAIVDPSPAAVEVAAKAGVPLYKTLDELLSDESPRWLDSGNTQSIACFPSAAMHGSETSHSFRKTYRHHCGRR